MRALNINSVVSRNEDVAYTYMDDEMVAMGGEDNLYYGVNAVGAEIWAYLDKGTVSIQGICDELQRRYDVAQEHCLTDVFAFVQQMHEKNMLIINPE